MKTRLPLRSFFLGALISAASLATSSASNFIVNWGGNYLAEGTTAINTTRSVTTVDQESLKGSLYGYSETTPLLSSGSTYSGTSATFYGVAQLTSPSNIGGVQLRVRSKSDDTEDWSTQNRLYIKSPNNVTTYDSQSVAKGMIFWKKEDFLSGDSAAPLTLNQLDQFVLSASYARVSEGTLRFAIQSDGVWYLSEEALTTGEKLAKPIGVLTLSDPGNSLWATWSIQDTPTSLLNSAPSSYEIDGSTLTNITAVGFYFEGTYSKSNAVMFGFDNFSVTSIPEPSTTAFLGGSTALLLGGLALKRKRK